MKLLIVAVLFSGCASHLAAADGLAELEHINRLYEEASRKAQAPIDARYLEMLEELVKKLNEDGEEKDALAVTRAIMEAKKKMDASASASEQGAPPSEAGEGTIVLKGESAVLEGSLKLQDGLVGNWVRTNCRATWHTRDVPAGKYDVFFVYDAAIDMGGTIELADFSYRFDAQIEPTSEEESLEVEKDTRPQPKGSSRPTKPKLVTKADRSLVFKLAKVGTIETRGGIGMKVSAKSVSEGGIMNLKEIRLVPIP